MQDFTYRHSECCDHTRNVDDMIRRFTEDRNTVLVQLTTDPISLANRLWDLRQSPLSIDRKCLCQMGTTLDKTISIGTTIEQHDDRIMKGLFRCAQCRNLGRLIDFKRETIGKPFLIECGKLVGQQMIVHRQPFSKLTIKPITEPRSMVQGLLGQYQDLSLCQPSLGSAANLQYLMCDPFTNELLINWLLDTIFENLELPHINRLYTGFVCGDAGYTLRQYPTIGYVAGLQGFSEVVDQGSTSPRPTAKADVRLPLRRDVVLGILQQLAVTLQVLAGYDVTHGAPSGYSLLFDGKPCSYRYDDIHVTCPITLKLTDFRFASMSIESATKPIRIFPYQVETEAYLSRFPFIPKIQTSVHVPFDCQDGICVQGPMERYATFMLDGETMNIMLSARHSGVPLFASAFDAYCFLITLMVEQPFFTTVINDPGLNQLWRSMWRPDEIMTINERLMSLHHHEEPIPSSVVINQLQGLHLRCDLVSYFWQQLRTISQALPSLS